MKKIDKKSKYFYEDKPIRKNNIKKSKSDKKFNKYKNYDIYDDE